MPNAPTLEERVRAIEVLPTKTPINHMFKTRELWRLGKVLFAAKSYPMSLHALAEAIRIGSRWIVANEGPRYWGDEVYNVFHRLPSVDKMELGILASWSHWWIIQVCANLVREQGKQLPRDVLTARLAEIRTLSSSFETKMSELTASDEAKTRPQQAAALWIALSIMYSSTRRHEDNLRCGNAAYACDPTNPTACLRAGLARLEAGIAEGTGECFERTLELLQPDSPDCITAHVGAAAVASGSLRLKHAREARRLGLHFASVPGFGYHALSPEAVAAWEQVRTELLAAPGICGWCLADGADKQCSACAQAVFCGPDCFRPAWKGDAMMPAHKASCKKI